MFAASIKSFGKFNASVSNPRDHCHWTGLSIDQSNWIYLETDSNCIFFNSKLISIQIQNRRWCRTIRMERFCTRRLSKEKHYIEINNWIGKHRERNWRQSQGKRQREWFGFQMCRKLCGLRTPIFYSRAVLGPNHLYWWKLCCFNDAGWILTESPEKYCIHNIFSFTPIVFCLYSHVVDVKLIF